MSEYTVAYSDVIVMDLSLCFSPFSPCC
uniref:Uncharacterized protein n=1 Tax=Anguilla anguilla TaxID=7936 RepID=A0A0E9SH53_ANGAN